MNKLKVLFCDNTLWGLVNFRGDVIEHFKHMGIVVVLVAPEKEDKQMQISLPEGVRYIPIAMRRTTINPIDDLKYFYRLFQIYQKEKPDFVFNYTIKPNIYGSISAHFLKCHSTAMMAGLGYTFKNNNFSSRIARFLYKVGLSFSDNLLILNNDNFELIKKMKLCKQDKIILLSGGEGVNVNKFKLYDNRSENTTFLFIGRVLWDKGYDEFSRAARIVKSRCQDTQFLVLGSLDPLYPKSVPIERIKKDESDGILEYIGFTNDMDTIYSKRGIVVTLPSYYGEGMNRSLMEACASGKPIICTDIPGCRELVDNGQNGFIVKPKDVDDLARAMIKYINMNNENKIFFSNHSREKAEKEFCIDKVLQIYDRIISNELS